MNSTVLARVPPGLTSGLFEACYSYNGTALFANLGGRDRSVGVGAATGHSDTCRKDQCHRRGLEPADCRSCLQRQALAALDWTHDAERDSCQSPRRRPSGLHCTDRAGTSDRANRRCDRPPKTCMGRATKACVLDRHDVCSAQFRRTHSEPAIQSARHVYTAIDRAWRGYALVDS